MPGYPQDGNTQNQINHIIINNRWRGSLQTQTTASARKDKRAPPLDVGKLRDPNVRQTYQTGIWNEVFVLPDQQEMDLYPFSHTSVEAGKKVTGLRVTNKDMFPINRHGCETTGGE